MQMTYFPFFKKNSSTHYFLSLFFLMGCASTPPTPPTPSAEEIKAQDIQIAAYLVQQIDPLLSLKNKPEISVYLRTLTQNLLNNSQIPTGVLLLDPIQGIWYNFSLPEARIYLSSGLLKKIGYENELASAIAIELAHLKLRHPVSNAQKNKFPLEDNTHWMNRTTHPSSVSLPLIIKNTSDLVGANGLFIYPLQNHLQACEEAVRILYQSGYDPRGLVSLWTLYKNNPKNSPFDPTQLEKFIDHTRRVIAQNAPLRNPIVRSQKFLEIQKRMKRL